MKKTLILILLALLAAPLWGQTKLSRIRTAAEQGDAMAQCALGCHYDSIQDFKQGLYWHQKASSLGYNWANCALGLYYATGKGVPLDRNKAVYWFDKAKKAGVPSELYPIIRYGEAMSGDPRTQCIIAVEIFKSPCNNRDEVNFWLSQSANQGYADAQFFLAVSLGEDGDHIKAFTWLIKAASQGHAEAQYLLGTQLYLGEAPLQLTPEAREKQALVWFKRAKAQESKLSEESRFMVNALIDEIEKSSNGTTSHRNAGATTPAKNTTTTSSSTPKKDTGMEFDENLRVTQRGNTPPVPAPSAAELFAQADNYRYGRNGVVKNAQKAVELYTQAANMGDAEAQLSLGYCYYMGEGVSENCQKAYEWLKKAEAKCNEPRKLDKKLSGFYYEEKTHD